LVICAVLQVSPAAAAGGAADVAKLNAQRAANGIPAGIAHVPEWSQWCDQHISYMEANGGGLSHDEQPGHPGYTVGGQMAGANSVLAYRASWDTANPWETAPIHLHQLLAPRLDAMGVAERDSYVCATTLLSRNRPAPASNVIYTYPGEGARHRFEETAAESPYTPGERVGIAKGTRTGPYLYLMADGPALDPFSHARITSASLTGPGGAVVLKVVDNFTSGLADYIPVGGQLIPERPLEPSTSYTARVSMQVFPSAGTAPVAISRQWSFSTVEGSSGTPGLRLVALSRHGRRLKLTLTTRRGAHGRLTLKIRRCVRSHSRCTQRYRVKVRHRRAGAVHRFAVRLPRSGRWSLRPQFKGTRGWEDQKLRAIYVRVR
jgi:hypothetical protein